MAVLMSVLASTNPRRDCMQSLRRPSKRNRHQRFLGDILILKTAFIMQERSYVITYSHSGR